MRRIFFPIENASLFTEAKKKHTHIYTHNFLPLVSNSLTHLHVASSESHKSNIKSLSLSLSHIAI
jgi:hypothetical protein